MARSLSSVRAFFQGLDDGMAQKRIDDEAEAKRKKEERDFLFAQTKEERAAAAEGREVISFDSQAPARANKLATDTEYGKNYAQDAELRARLLNQTRTTAVNAADNFDANLPDITKNAAAKATQAVTAQTLDLAQNAEYLKQIQENPYIFNAKVRMGDAQIGAAGVESVDSIIAKRGLTLPPELAGAGEVTKLQWLENSGNFLNKTQAEITATQKATEKAAAAAAAALALADANNKSKANIAEGKNTTSTTNTQTRVNAKNPPAATPAATPTAVPRVGLGIDSPPLPSPVLPTPPAPAMPAVQPAPVDTLTPGEQEIDNIKVSQARLAREIETLKPPYRNGRNPTAYLAWQASGKAEQYATKQEELKRLGQLYVSILRR